MKPKNENKIAPKGDVKATLQSLHEDLEAIKTLGFLYPEAKIGLGTAIEQVERYIRGDLKARK